MNIIKELEIIVKAKNILQSDDDLAFYGGDIYGALENPMAVVLPANTSELVDVVRTLYKAGVPMTTRGAGASYTQAHVPAVKNAVVIDTQRLNIILDLDLDNLTVTVGPGCTWNTLNEELRKHKLRSPFWGSYSGYKATVGGSVSQHAIALGSGTYGTSADSVIGMSVVTADGELVHTAGEKPFHRSYGPDMTGLFCGDSGTLGVKASITLKVFKRPEYVAGASFGYATFEQMSRALTEIASANVAAENVVIDPVLQRGQMGSATMSDMLSAIKSVASSAPNPFAAIVALLKAALGARSFLKSPCYVANFLCEGHSDLEARAKLSIVRQYATANGGAEMSNVLPLAMHDVPFRPLRPVLGPQGERWLPMHCVLSYGNIQAFHKDLVALYAENEQEMQQRDVFIGTMFLTVGYNTFVYEPTFYWKDSQHAVHQGLMEDEDWKPLPTYPDNPDTREFVFALKKRMIKLMQTHGAVHYQLGKSYPYLSNCQSGQRQMVLGLKQLVDPRGLFNPGALEFPVEN